MRGWSLIPQMMLVFFEAIMHHEWILEYDLVNCIDRELMGRFVVGDLCAGKKGFGLIQGQDALHL